MQLGFDAINRISWTLDFYCSVGDILSRAMSFFQHGHLISMFYMSRAELFSIMLLQGHAK